MVVQVVVVVLGTMHYQMVIMELILSILCHNQVCQDQVTEILEEEEEVEITLEQVEQEVEEQEHQHLIPVDQVHLEKQYLQQVIQTLHLQVVEEEEDGHIVVELVDLGVEVQELNPLIIKLELLEHKIQVGVEELVLFLEQEQQVQEQEDQVEY